MSNARETLENLLATAVDCIHREDEEGLVAVGAGLLSLVFGQVIRIADAAEKLAGLMDVTVSNVAEVLPHPPAPPVPEEAPYSRPECSFIACPSKEACTIENRCHAPAGWVSPASKDPQE